MRRVVTMFTVQPLGIYLEDTATAYCVRWQIPGPCRPIRFPGSAATPTPATRGPVTRTGPRTASTAWSLFPGPGPCVEYRFELWRYPWTTATTRPTRSEQPLRDGRFSIVQASLRSPLVNRPLPSTSALRSVLSGEKVASPKNLRGRFRRHNRSSRVIHPPFSPRCDVRFIACIDRRRSSVCGSNRC
jgi:hypothetical protein